MGREDPPEGAITSFQLKRRLESSGANRPLLVDIREPDEYEDWRIGGSLNIPLNVLRSPEGLKRLPREDEIVTICAHGIRSSEAAKFLRSAGFKARVLIGGLVAWSKIYDVAPVTIADEDSLKLLQIRRIGKGCTSYMIGYRSECAVIDPSVHTREFIAIARGEGMKIRHVMDTHLHADHVSGARALARASRARLYLNSLDGYRFNGFVPLRDGDAISLGDGEVIIEALHTPGHTRGSTSFLVQGKGILTGDILFVEGVARPDLHEQAEEFALDLYHTYRNKLLSLPEEVAVLPAHFSQAVKIEFGKPFSSTLQGIRKKIPLMAAGKKGFINYVLKNIPPKPPNHEAILRINRGDDPYDPSLFDELEEGPNRCAVRA